MRRFGLMDNYELDVGLEHKPNMEEENVIVIYFPGTPKSVSFFDERIRCMSMAERFHCRDILYDEIGLRLE